VNLGQLTTVKNENKSGNSSDFSQAMTFSDLYHWDMQLVLFVLHSCIVFHRVKETPFMFMRTLLE